MSEKPTAAAEVPLEGPALEEKSAELEPWEQELEIWFQDLRVNLAHLDTAVHNHIFTAKEQLKKRLRGFIA